MAALITKREEGKRIPGRERDVNSDIKHERRHDMLTVDLDGAVYEINVFCFEGSILDETHRFFRSRVSTDLIAVGIMAGLHYMMWHGGRMVPHTEN